LEYGDDVSWHPDPNNLRWINPKGAVKGGRDIDGFIPDDMRRGGSFQWPPKYTNYQWEGQQGWVMGARILERVGAPIWEVGDRAIYRAFYALQVRLGNQFSTWKASGDDLWLLPFIDAAYGTSHAAGLSDSRQHGKNCGWPYVVS
jgi:hypothetical protein